MKLLKGKGKRHPFVANGYVEINNHQAEREPQTSEERYRLLAENVSDTVWLMDLNFHVIYISPSVTRLRGYTLDELNEIPIDQQMTPDSYRRAMTLFYEVLSPENLAQKDKEITASIELEFYKKDGSSFWSENNFVLLRDEQGLPVNILSTGRDITERKHTMEALQYSENRYRSLIDQAANGLFVHDFDGRLLDVNQRACESLGYTSDELLQMNILDIEQDIDLASARRLWANIKPGNPSILNSHQKRKDGTVFPVEVHFASLDIHGQRLIMGLVNDITERKQAEDTIRYQANLIEQISDAIVSTDLNDNIMSWNRSAELMYGWRADEVLGKPLDDIVKTTFLETTRSHMEEDALTYGIWVGEILQSDRKGKAVAVQATVSTIKDETGKVSGYVFLLRDITVNKQVMEALQVSEERHRSLFVNMMEGYAYCKMLYDHGRPVDFIYVAVNPAFEKLTGLKNVIGEPVSKIIPGLIESNPELFEIYSRVTLTGTPEKFETYIPALDLWLSISVYRPAPEHFVTVFDNINERKRTEEKIRQSEERISLVMRSAQIGTWDWNTVNGELLWSPQCLAFFGLSLDGTMTYERFLNAVHPDDRTRVDMAIQAALIHKGDYEEEVRTVWPDGSVHWITLRGRVYSDASGQAIRMTGAAMDITDRMQNEEAIRVRDELLNLTGEMAHVGGWEFDTDTLKGTWTDEVARIHELDPTQPTNAELGLSYYTGESRKKIDHAIREATESGTPYDLELEMVTPAGNHKWVRTIGIPVKMDTKVTKLKGIFQDITERIQAEEALRESEERYRHLFYNAQVGLFRANSTDGKIIACNQYFAQRIGYRTAEQCRAEYHLKEYPSDRKGQTQILREVQKKGKIEDNEIQILTRDKKSLWVNLSAKFYPKKGFVEGAIVDITDRKLTEVALLQSEERFSKAFRANPAAVMITRISDGKIIDVNDSFLHTMGYSRPEVIDRNVLDLKIHTNDADWVELERSLQIHGFVHNYETVLRTKNSDLKYFILSAEMITLADEACLLSVMYDISARKHAEEEIQRMNTELEEIVRKRTAEFSDLYNNAPCGYHSLDKDGNILYINDTELKWLGYKREEVVGKKKIYEFFTPESVAVFKKSFPNFLKQGWIQDLEFELLRTDGSILPVLLSGSAVYDRDGQFLMSRSTMTDHTAYKNTEAALRESQARLESANKELEAFSFSVSHDLRAPLRRIDGWSLALLEDYNDQLDDTARKYLGRVRAETQHMGVLIDDLLMLSRVTRVEMKHDPVNLSDLAQAINLRLQETQPDRQVDIEIQPGLFTHGDPSLLSILLTNLFDNAWKYTGTRPVAHIEFGLMLNNDHPTYYIKDNGVGYDMAYADKLFQVFQRLHNTAEFTGIGIGLATVQRIVQRHGGQIWSEGQVDQGATFYFTLGDAA